MRSMKLQHERVLSTGSDCPCERASLVRVVSHRRSDGSRACVPEMKDDIPRQARAFLFVLRSYPSTVAGDAGKRAIKAIWCIHLNRIARICEERQRILLTESITRLDRKRRRLEALARVVLQVSQIDIDSVISKRPNRRVHRE
jgi:hypothetical protein